MPITSALKSFLKHEAFGGILLVLAALCALIVTNSPLGQLYQKILHFSLSIPLGPLTLSKSLEHWVNDGLMVIFFLVVGLEIKRELVIGELSSNAQRVLPTLAAVGGMLVPALIFIVFNWGNAETIHGWAIPAATDIAFSLGVISLLGSRVPISLKVFLTALAIIDDLGAIIIIACFYTATIHFWPLVFGILSFLALLGLNRSRVQSLTPYLLIGLVLWISILKSGVHATVAGVLLGFTIPLGIENSEKPSPLATLERRLHPWVAYCILPIFAFANAGVSLQGIGFEAITSSLTLGIALGLFFGKQLGVFLFTWATVRCGWSKLPEGAGWSQMYGIALLAGIGFTMSLFIGSLAYQSDILLIDTRLGVILGSVTSAVAGYFVLKKF